MMRWIDIEMAFSRAVSLSFSRKKIFLTFPILVFCGIVVVFARAIAYGSGEWVGMSLTFLSFLFSAGILLALGVLLIRLYTHEIKGLHLPFRRLITGSIDLIMGTSYLSIPPILAYLFLWIALGIFYLLGEIPIFGPFFRIVFSFGPFLLIFASLLLCLSTLLLLFFIAPAAAFQSVKKISMAQRILAPLKGRILTGIFLFLLAFFPLGLLCGLLTMAAYFTNVEAVSTLSVAMEWFFLMLPFSALLTPAAIFFFHFAAESYHLLKLRAL